jgi:hypothetical protein
MTPTTDHMKGKGATAVDRKKRSLLLPILGIALSILLLVLAWRIANRPTPSSGSTGSIEKTDRISQEEIDAFYNEQVRPALHDYQVRNKAAVDRAVERITKGVDSYKDGIPAFVDDITSWGTRFGIIGRKSRDLWDKWWGDVKNERRVYEYVSAKFEKHLFSDAKLRSLVEGSLTQFKDDLRASQNTLHADIKTAWNASPLASKEFDMQEVVARVQAEISDVSTQMATDSVTVGVLAFVGGFALEEATRALVRVIVARVGAYLATSAATTTATSGGATGTAAAAGGAGGSTVGPWGTVIGVAAGIVVGMVADWWMSNQFEKKLTGECTAMIEQVKAQLLMGSDDAQGMKDAFIESIRIFQKAEEQAIQTALMEPVQ